MPKSLTQDKNNRLNAIPGIEIVEYSRIWGDIDLHNPDVQIGSHTVVGGHTFVATHCPIRSLKPGGLAVRIGHDVWIGYGCIIVPGVKIGDRTLVGAGSIVTQDIPADVIVVGNPAKPIKPRNQYEIIRTHLLVEQGLTSAVYKDPDWSKLTVPVLARLFDQTEQKIRSAIKEWKQLLGGKPCKLD